MEGLKYSYKLKPKPDFCRISGLEYDMKRTWLSWTFLDAWYTIYKINLTKGTSLDFFEIALCWLINVSTKCCIQDMWNRYKLILVHARVTRKSNKKHSCKGLPVDFSGIKNKMSFKIRNGKTKQEMKLAEFWRKEQFSS